MSLSFSSLRSKVCVLVLTLLGLTTTASYIATVEIMKQSMLDEIVKRASSLSRNIAAVAAYSLMSKDLLGLDNIVYKSKSTNNDVEYIMILDSNKRAVVHSDIKHGGEKLKPSEGKLIAAIGQGLSMREVKGPSGRLFEVTCPISFMDKQLGLVVLGINGSALEAAQIAARDRILGVFAIILICGTVACIALSSTMTRPIKALSAGIEKFKNGNKNEPLRIYSSDELGTLTKNFNEMTGLISEQRDRLSTYAQDLEESYVSMVKVVAAAIDARDPYTHGHSVRVAQLSLWLAREIGLNKEELADLEISCLLHDVGKIKIPDAILRKASELDAAEYGEIMLHPNYGSDILSRAPSLHKYIAPVRHHHEWFNGQGYPDKLMGEGIPLFAAIISIADAYDLMTSERPYRKALSREKALQELLDSAGRQFDPRIVDTFISLMENNYPSLSKQETHILW